MSIKSILTAIALIASTGSFAAAGPRGRQGMQWSWGSAYRPVVRDHRRPYQDYQEYQDSQPDQSYGWYDSSSDPGPSPQPPVLCDEDGDDCSAPDPEPSQGPVLLASSVRISNDYLHRAVINLGGSRGAFSSLRLDAFGGVYIRQLVVQFADGRPALVYSPQRFLGGSERSVTIQLGSPAPVASIVIYGRNASRAASLAISGM